MQSKTAKPPTQLATAITYALTLVLGYFHFILGVAIFVIATPLVPKLLKREPINLPADIIPKASRSAWMNLIGRFLLLLVIFLPTTDWFDLPTGQSPDSLIKYLSIITVLPQNLSQFNTSSLLVYRAFIFPGIPILVALGILLIIVASSTPNRFLNKTTKIKGQLAGMLLLTAAPILGALLAGRGTNFYFGYTLVYYLGWIGIALQLISRRIKDEKKLISGKSTREYAINLRAVQIAMLIMPILITAQLGILAPKVAEDTWLGSFESAHHNLLAAIMALIALFFGISSCEETKEDEEQLENTISLELRYPIGTSPKVFTRGWAFGARGIVNQGTDNEEDVSENVKWSGSAAFEPNIGSRSRPAFFADGPNNITLTCEGGGRVIEKTYHIEAVSNAGYAHVGSYAFCPADAHGCPACPHPVTGPIQTGSPNVLINGQPAARVGDTGQHAACCGPNTFTVGSGDSEVLIDGKPAARIGDRTDHCGGTGQITS